MIILDERFSSLLAQLFVECAGSIHEDNQLFVKWDLSYRMDQNKPNRIMKWSKLKRHVTNSNYQI